VSDRNDLIEISGTENPDRRGDVIFVHGLGGDALSTWHPQERRDDDNFWPAWLGEDLSDVGIWSLAYEVEPFRWKGNSMPLVDRATNSLDLLDSYEIGDRPIIFVTHSMGGLLVKQMLRSARDFGKWQAIASGTRGIVFLSTPHSGSDLASWINYIGRILQTTVSVEELKAHHSRLRELNLLYRNDDQFSQIPMLVYCETRPTNGILVVNQTSADPGIKGVIPVPMDVDHISICKVENKKNRIYRQVKRFVNQNLKTPLPLIQPKVAVNPDSNVVVNSDSKEEDAKKKVDDGLGLKDQCKELTRDRLGSEHTAVATYLDNLANLYRDQGRYSEAESLFVQALEITKKVYGQQHPSVAESLNSLALLYKNQGRYCQAEALYVQALEIRKKLLASGKNHPTSAT